MMLDALQTYGLKAVDIYENNGDEALSRYLRNTEKKKKVQIYLFDPSGTQIGNSPGKGAPSDVAALAGRTADTLFSGGQVSAFRVMASAPIFRPVGTYVVCGSVSRAQLAATQNQRLNAPRSTHRYRFDYRNVLLWSGAVFWRRPSAKFAWRRSDWRRAICRRASEPNRFPRGKDELTRLARDFDTMASRLEGLVTAQNRLLGDVSHELRTPLTRLNLSLELARRGDEAKREAALNRIERESQRLDELIRELLTLSRLENGLPASKLNEPLDLAELAHEIAADADFEARGAGRGVRVEYKGAPQHIMTRGDGELLRRAIEKPDAQRAAPHERKLGSDN